ncbi:DNA mismatch repair protein MutS domain protein [Methanobacterium lacus]|uniref:DNA-binding protein MutS2 n=1 Tax=Methanobacterium lacus (strain AL-21) TaxID=877455 RepID=F0T9L6_METLA|nr:helix-hairpin-helix domain-containing protein [Methanobacterium lacus]ADZ08764.1 DNA mismatch repair protein MutS domain protein [Methanobacterium lacus]
MDLRDIKGIGERQADKILSSFGGEKEFYRAVKHYEVDKLTNIEGVSQRKAIEIINALLGNQTKEFLKTDNSRLIYDDIIERILRFSSTNYSRNRILLMSPLKDEASIMENVEFVMAAKEFVSTLPVDELKTLLKKINTLEEAKPKYDPSSAILVETREDYHQLIESGLNSYSSIITGEELETPEDYEFIVYVYNQGLIEIESENMAMVTSNAEQFEIVPDTVLAYYKKNYDVIKNSHKIKQILQKESVLGDVIKIIDSLEPKELDESIFDHAVEEAKKDADLKLKNAIKQVDLNGDEVLDLLNEGMPKKLQQIFDEVMNQARATVKEQTGCVFDPFIQKYPVEIDTKELERIKKQEAARKYVKIFEENVTAATTLSKMKDIVKKEIHDILLFDYEFTLGCFAYYYQLNPPIIGEGFSFKEGIHLKLALENSEDTQMIDYSLQSPDNVVLLTGANSGGKTTLLETLAQICIMSQMGLPVRAKNATVKIVDELYFFSKKRSLDAGAFESFLRTFMPIVTRETDKLILLDELEAITELEASVKIISSFMDFIGNSDSLAIIVTHMATEILKYTDVRVDGIEAKGLDENYNLIVDRTPRMNYFARSTPELILRKMYEKSDPKLKDIYRQVLEKF